MKYLTPIVWIAIPVAALCVLELGPYSPSMALSVASGLVSHQVCSSVFVSHLDADETLREVSPTLGPLSHFAHFSVDWTRQRVNANIAGVAHSSAVYRGAEGCLVLIGGDPKPRVAVQVASTASSLLGELSATDVVKPINSGLDLAFARAFVDRFYPAPATIRIILDNHSAHVAPGDCYPNYPPDQAGVAVHF